MKRVVFIGQAPARPGSRHDVPGSYMRSWLNRIDVDEDAMATYFRFYALVTTFPGSDKAGHLRPTPELILEHRPMLIKNMSEFQPAIIVPVGSMAIAEIIPSAKGKLSGVVGNTFLTNPYNCLTKAIMAIPLPHPSGRSTWITQHAEQLDRALALLQAAL